MWFNRLLIKKKLLLKSAIKKPTLTTDGGDPKVRKVRGRPTGLGASTG
jgi:hypothetical protein